MNDKLINLGILLLAILLVVSVGSVALLINNSTNNIIGIGLGIILVLVVITFVGYLLLDLYNSMNKEKNNPFFSAEESTSTYESRD